ncbi:hypothetical protein Hypma_008698 [Hypsizygus marmoreus]|uniref:Histone H1 n=1 Tax=Hypsizygus marmoreus TaxID=39966 RepID=A0A369JXT0_HYPMA|nr:hypothetical protein Hypma_008698 [Hypsizygus marmoreus]
MQATGVYASSSSHLLYQNAYHAALAGAFAWAPSPTAPDRQPQDHELKKQYLALLPPQQIIEICLNFDLHVPPYVKSTVWPADINAAIAAMRKASPAQADPPAAAQSSSSETTTAAMGSLTDSTDASSAAAQLVDTPGETRPPDKSSPTPDASKQSTPAPTIAPTEPANPAPQPTPYPHQPYGYPHAQAAYPHAPYYQHAPGYPAYPTAYSYAQIPGYPPPPPPPATYPQQPANSPFTNAPLTHPQPQPDAYGNTTSADDLPSYEEMIVEALMDTADPEGCAPKDLFNWMAARYPLQSNFRPSASQALQKAFKRGRFQKSSGGKYRLNAGWEGGSTSRRTTRRPQTHTQITAPPAAPASPFTHAPLVHNNQTTPAAPNHAYPPGYGFPYAQGYPGYPQPHPPASQTQAQVAATSTPAPATEETQQSTHADGSVEDAYEAAHNILKAINFHDLLQLPAEEEEKVPGDSSGGERSAAAEMSNAASTLPPSTTGFDHFPETVPGTADGVSATEYPGGNPRAELQAQLALLAAQLAELAQTDAEDEDVMGQQHDRMPVPSTLVPPVDPSLLVPEGASHPPVQHPPVAAMEEEEDSDDDDMEEVI